jgi:MoaA/NifB/PqqE/SkfB family radical SAM enzyme
MRRVIPAELGRLVRRMLAVRAGARPLPFAISFLVTARCVLRCRHCFYHYAQPNADDELTLAQYELLSRGLGRFPVALFCGGEPYLRPDFAEIVNLVRRRNGAPLSSATTNGQLTDEVVTSTEAIVRADRAKPFMLGISIEGPEEIHDHIRGPGTYAQALRTWAECRRLRRHYPNLVLSVTTVMSTLNEQHAPGFVRWAARALAPDAQVILLVRQDPRAGPGIKAVNLRLYREAQAEALRAMRADSWLGRLRPDAAYLAAVASHVARTQARGARSFHCWAGVHGAVIDPTGRVHVCEVLAEHADVPALGSLREVGMSLGALWNGEAARRALELVNQHPACAACTHETMGHAASLVFPPNWLWRKRRLAGRAGQQVAPSASVP